jgi:hypothetical protein
MFTADGVHALRPHVETWEPVVAARPDALLYATMAAGARGIAIEARRAHVEGLARRGLGGTTLAGSVNVGLTSDGTAPDAAHRHGRVPPGAIVKLDALGRRPATCAEAREMLGVPAG